MLADSARRGAPDPLIKKSKAGDRQALEALLRRDGPAVGRLISRLVGDGADAQDLLQTTFAEAIKSLPSFRGDAEFRTWLSRIAVNVVRQAWRRKSVRARAQLSLVHAAEVNVEPRVDRVANARRQLERVYHHLLKLSVKKRLAFALHVIDGRPMEEVAALMGASVTATRSRVYWARRSLLSSAKRDPLLAVWAKDEEMGRS